MESPLFSLRTDNARVMSIACSSLLWKELESQIVTIIAGPDELAFASEESTVVKAYLSFPRGIFTEYNFYADEKQAFSLNLSYFVKCLGMHGKSITILDIKSFSTSEIKVMISDSYATSDCTIRTHLLKYPSNMDRYIEKFSSQPVHAHIVLSSEALKELFKFPFESRLAPTVIRFLVNSRTQKFDVRAEGSFGVIKTSMPPTLAMWMTSDSDSSSDLEVNCAISSIVPVLRALPNASDVEFKFLVDGSLSITLIFTPPGTSYQAKTVFFIVETDSI